MDVEKMEMTKIAKGDTLLKGLEISEMYKGYYTQMSCGTVETFRILSDEIDENIAVINDTLETGYYTGEDYHIIMRSKGNFINAKNSLEYNTLKFLGYKK